MQTQRFLQPNPPLSMEDIVARENIKELITYERFCRDNSLWYGMRTCFTSDSEVTISWFKGTGDEFVDHSQAMQRYAPHQIYNIQVWQNGARAIAVMQATIQSRLDIESETYELQSDAKITYRVVKQDETWRIQHLDCVYEQDRLMSVLPTSSSFDRRALAPYRESYACLSYCLNYLGYDVNHQLIGIDQPEALEDFYVELDAWLMRDSE